MIYAVISLAALVVFFLWYVRTLLRKLNYIVENLGELLVSVEEYAVHLDSVHALEMFYGDETLQHLIKHSKVVVKNIRQFEDIFSLTHNEELLRSEKVEESTEEETEEEVVFYKGPRTSDS